MKASFPSSVSSSPETLPTFPSLLPSGSWLYTTAAILLSLLVLEQTVYRYKKRHLPGDKWTIPLIGKFADSMNPTMEGYMKQWQSGALSALSVFNMYVALSLSILCSFFEYFMTVVLLLWRLLTSMLVKS
jgi:sterol 22-desaturase